MTTKRSGSSTRQRTKLVALRLLPEERQTLEAAAEREHISLSELIRRAALKAVTGKDQS